LTEASFAAAVPVGAWHDRLPLTLKSLAAQTMPLEVALMDASSDPRVAAAAAESGLAFTHHREGPDEGQASAIVEGWANTTSDIVFWLNADDRLSDGALTRVAQIFGADPSVDVVFGGSDFIDADGARVGVHDQISDATPLLLRSNVISQPSCFVRRTKVEAVGGLNSRLHFVMDWDLWVRLYKSGARFVRVDETFSEVYMGAGTKTASLKLRRLLEIFALVNRHAGLWAATKSTLAVSLETLSRRQGTA
jgi:glycosyltransferase involved in cell wall biosynthesis